MILILTLMSLIIRIWVDIRNSFNFTILVPISADTIRIVYEMRPCADILSGQFPVNTFRYYLSTLVSNTILKEQYGFIAL